MTPAGRRRLLGALTALTVVVLGLDLSHPELTAPLRDGAATVVGPLERVVRPDHDSQVAQLTRERDRLRDRLTHERSAVRDARAVTDLVQSPSARGRRLVPARVVGRPSVGAPDRTGRLTIDAGSRDGVTKDLTVISADGLVGRVVAVAPWTADVLVIGGPDLTVGVRAGTRGSLGSVSAAPVQGLPPRQRGELTLTLVEQGSTRRGAILTTLGSVGDRPFVPGIRVGTVASVDPARGQLGRTAAVRPAVDPSTLDLVGVVRTSTRDAPRKTVSGEAP